MTQSTNSWSSEERAVDSDDVLFRLDTRFLEQCLTRNRHPIHIYRMNSPFSCPAIDVKAKGPGVLQAIYRPQRAPESLQFP